MAAAAAARDVDIVVAAPAPQPQPQPREKLLPAVAEAHGEQPLPEKVEDTVGSLEAQTAEICDAPEPEPAAQLQPAVVEKKLCHQCRQYRMEVWAKCNGDDGEPGKPCTKRFCTECLKSRYGSQEPQKAHEPDWICPKCRGICNCSCCRKKKGLEPIGKVHSLRASLGFISIHEILQKMTQEELKKKQAELKRDRQMETLHDTFGDISVQEIKELMTDEKLAQTQEMLELDEKKGKKRARKTKMAEVHVAELASPQMTSTPASATVEEEIWTNANPNASTKD